MRLHTLVLSQIATTAAATQLLLVVLVLLAARPYPHVVVRSHTQPFEIDDVLIRKPYEQVCEQDAVEPSAPEVHIDQTRPECPLPLNTSSRSTGCVCQFELSRIECIYADRLAKLPHFYSNNYQRMTMTNGASSSNTNDSEYGLSSTSSPSPPVNMMNWSVDLRCKNVTRLDGFEFITNLTHVSEIDLSGLTYEQYFNRCKFVEPLNYINRSNLTTPIKYLNQVGMPLKKLIKTKQKVSIDYLNLESNQIRGIFMQGEPVYIKRLNLARNQLESVSIRKNLDMCTLRIDVLNVSSNRIRELEIGYLLFLRVLNVSNNELSKFGVDFYDTGEFFAYSKDVCQLNYTEQERQQQGNENSHIYQPYILSSKLVEIDFSNNMLTNLPFSFIKNVAFLKLEKLIVASNRLKSLGQYELKNLKNIRYLSLRSNFIENIDEQAFVDLTRLKYLDLSVNLLQTIPDKLFTSQNNSLETLWFSHNYLETIPDEAFGHLHSLKYINLNCNRLRAIHNYSFGHMSSLVEVSLAANVIDSIEPEAFTIAQRSLLGPGLIEKLDLSGNKLVSLNQTVFFYLTNLRHLVLSNNKIRFIDRKVFRGIGFLITLDLSFNQLSSLDFLANRNFSVVRYLTLSNNRLRRLRATQFVFLKSLTHLDLSANRISRIEDCAFSGLEHSIRRVYLNYNRIRRLNSCAFAIDFRQLRFVQILGNPLNCSHNCEFFYVIYNPPYSINYEGFECANVTATNFSHCSTNDFDLVYKKCRAKMRGDRNCSKLVADIRAAQVDDYGMIEKSTHALSSAEDTSAEDYATVDNIKAIEGSLVEDYDEEERVPTSKSRYLANNYNLVIKLAFSIAAAFKLSNIL